jgi:hypothetical protein
VVSTQSTTRYKDKVFFFFFFFGAQKESIVAFIHFITIKLIGYNYNI